MSNSGQASADNKLLPIRRGLYCPVCGSPGFLPEDGCPDCGIDTLEGEHYPPPGRSKEEHFNALRFAWILDGTTSWTWEELPLKQPATERARQILRSRAAQLKNIGVVLSDDDIDRLIKEHVVPKL